MSQSTVFHSHKSQAIRLPKAVALPSHVKKVNIIVQGNARLIVPVETSWDDFYAMPSIGDDYMKDREQPMPQKRKDLD